MKLLFLPDIPNDIEICSQLKEMLRDDINIVFYLTPIELISSAKSAERIAFLTNVAKNRNIERSRILFVAPGDVIQEGGLGHLLEDEYTTRCAVPGNKYYDFIPAVINYYAQQQINIEDMAIILESRRIQDRLYDIKDDQRIYYSREKIEELEEYLQKNNIKYLKPDYNWQECLTKIGGIYHLEKVNSLSLDLDILYHPFFSSLQLSNKFSMLFTDRDGTIFISNSLEQTYENFESMRSFLQEGNLVTIISSTNHAATLFQEGGVLTEMWDQLSIYKNQIIGFSGIGAATTLEGIKIPIGYDTVSKCGIVEQVVDMFSQKGYEVNKIFCMGDAPVDMDMIIDTVSKFDATGYLINNGIVLSKIEGLDFFTNQDWDYLKDHRVDSFSIAMKQHILSKIKSKKKRINDNL